MQEHKLSQKGISYLMVVSRKKKWENRKFGWISGCSLQGGVRRKKWKTVLQKNYNLTVLGAARRPRGGGRRRVRGGDGRHHLVVHLLELRACGCINSLPKFDPPPSRRVLQLRIVVKSERLYVVGMLEKKPCPGVWLGLSLVILFGGNDSN